MAQQKIQTFETSLLLKMEINQDDKDRAAQKLANATELHGRLIEERKATNSDYTDRIHQQRGVMSAEAKTVKYGLREVETDVKVEFNREKNLIRYTRIDSNELVNGEDWHPATDKEHGLANAMLQKDLPGTEEDQPTGEDSGSVVKDLDTSEE